MGGTQVGRRAGLATQKRPRWACEVQGAFPFSGLPHVDRRRMAQRSASGVTACVSARVFGEHWPVPTWTRKRDVSPRALFTERHMSQTLTQRVFRVYARRERHKLALASVAARQHG